MESSITLAELATVARDIASQTDRPGALSRTVDIAAKLLPCTMVDIVHVVHERAFPVASTDMAASRQVVSIDSQRRTTAADGRVELDVLTGTCPAPDTASPDRGRRLFAASGFRSEMSFPLRSELSGAYLLRVFSVDGDPWSLDDRALAAAFVDIAGVAVDRVVLDAANTNLRLALDSNRIIGTAIGILMTSHRITVDRAFDLLRTCSQHSNRKLRGVAEDVVLTGALPDRAGDVRTK